MERVLFDICKHVCVCLCAGRVLEGSGPDLLPHCFQKTHHRAHFDWPIGCHEITNGVRCLKISAQPSGTAASGSRRQSRPGKNLDTATATAKKVAQSRPGFSLGCVHTHSRVGSRDGRQLFLAERGGSCCGRARDTEPPRFSSFFFFWAKRNRLATPAAGPSNGHASLEPVFLPNSSH